MNNEIFNRISDPLLVTGPTDTFGVDYTYGPFSSIEDAIEKLVIDGKSYVKAGLRICTVSPIDGEVNLYYFDGSNFVNLKDMCNAAIEEKFEDNRVSIGENGNWFIGGIDTGFPSRGEKGDKGDQGDKGDKGDKGNPGEDGSDGQDGADATAQSCFTSYMFKRSDGEPTDILTTEGSFAYPSPFNTKGWEDGIPHGTDQIWMQSRLFTSDGREPQFPEWTAPTLMADKAQELDVCFHPATEDGLAPLEPTHHGDQGSDLTTWHNDGNPNDVWMAVSKYSNGWGYWSIMKIKGEDAADIDWLTRAFEEGTTDIDGGVVLTNLLQLRDLDKKVTAGMSGMPDGVLLWGGSTYREALHAAQSDYRKSEGGELINTLLKDNGTGKIGHLYVGENGSGSLGCLSIDAQGNLAINHDNTKTTFDKEGNINVIADDNRVITVTPKDIASTVGLRNDSRIIVGALIDRIGNTDEYKTVRLFSQSSLTDNLKTISGVSVNVNKLRLSHVEPTLPTLPDDARFVGSMYYTLQLSYSW